MNANEAQPGPLQPQPEHEPTAEQRIMNMLQNLHSQNRTMQDQQAAQEQRWQESFDSLRKQIPMATSMSHGSTTPQIIEPTTPLTDSGEATTQIAPDLVGTRHVLPQLSAFEGDKDLYDGWRQEACNKIAVDGPRIGNSNIQMAYVYACLKGTARERTLHIIGQANQDFISLLTELDKWFQDRSKTERALQDFDKCYQNGHSFGDFWIKYHSLAFKSRAMADWTDSALIQHLKKRVALKLHDMATPAVLVSSPSTIVQLAQIYESMDLAHRARHRENSSEGSPSGQYQQTQVQPAQQLQQQLAQQDNTMDWVATNQVRRTYDYVKDTRPVAQFAPQKEIEARRAADVCFTCGNSGHQGRNCAFKRHPNNLPRRQRSPRRQAPLTQVFLTSAQTVPSVSQQQRETPMTVAVSQQHLSTPVTAHATVEAGKASP
jgi:hypothetical protein